MKKQLLVALLAVALVSLLFLGNAAYAKPPAPEGRTVAREYDGDGRLTGHIGPHRSSLASPDLEPLCPRGVTGAGSLADRGGARR